MQHTENNVHRCPGKYAYMLETVLRSRKEVIQTVKMTVQDLLLSASYCIPLLPCSSQPKGLVINIRYHIVTLPNSHSYRLDRWVERNTEKQAELITGMVLRRCEGGIASYRSALFMSHIYDFFQYPISVKNTQCFKSSTSVCHQVKYNNFYLYCVGSTRWS